MTEALTWMSGHPEKAVMSIAAVAAFGLVAWLIQTMIERRK